MRKKIAYDESYRNITPHEDSLKGEALSDIAAAMEQKTGVHLTVDRAIADQKATIFVDDKPQTLIKIKENLPESLVVEVCQGHYSKEDHILHKKFDATIDNIADLLSLDFIS